MSLTQQQRLLNLTTPLGEDVLLLTGFTGQEEISGLFSFELEMISDDAHITAAQTHARVGRSQGCPPAGR